jgi:biotin carboxyl carrier protein
MTFEIEIQGRRTEVLVEPSANSGRFRITLRPAATLPERPTAEPSAAAPEAIPADDQHAVRAFDVDVRRTAFGVALAYAADGRFVDAAVTLQPDGWRLVQLPHVDVQARLDGRRTTNRSTAAPAGRAHRVTAPMPGRILRVLVQVGDAVEARQALLVMEAMKMENELRAPAAGRVFECAVLPGASVEAGRELVEIE